VDTTLRAHGFAASPSITYLRKGRALREAVQAILDERVGAGRLVILKVPGHGPVYIEPDRFERRAPRSAAQVRILSPFDNCVIQRSRVRDIFAFDYQIECYVPAAKRQYGYFCLPLLYRDRFVGRIDCKTHRKQRCLELRSLHLEKRTDDRFVDELTIALDRFAAFNGCTQIELSCTRAAHLLGVTNGCRVREVV